MQKPSTPPKIYSGSMFATGVMRESMRVRYALGCLAIVSGCNHRSSSLEEGSETQAFSSAQKIGRKIVTFPVSGRPNEICVLPTKTLGFDYSEKDNKIEEKLCTYDFHASESSGDKVAVNVCPKTNSTNPGLDIHELKAGVNKATFESKTCDLPDRGAKKLAKYKTSISCSYTGSILGYYHMSAALGGAGDVPTAVVRSFDIEKHKPYTQRALAFTNGEFINSLWAQVSSAENHPAKLAGRMFSSDLKQIYGALSKNPTDEDRYSEINSGSMATFMNSTQTKRVLNPASVASLAGRSLADVAQIVVQMKDISDMLLLDYLFKQQDRYGNIHKVEFFYFLDEKGKIDKVKVEDVNEKKEPKPANGVLVKKMLLKDNDCGGRPGAEKNVTDAQLSSIRHMSPKTYKRLQWVAQNWDSGFKDFFGKEALLAEPDLFGSPGISVVTKSVKAAAKILKDNCSAGKLLLDLDLEDHLAAKNTEALVKAKCNEVFVPKDPGAPEDNSDDKPDPVPTPAENTCTNPPLSKLSTLDSKWNLAHGGANGDKFKADVTVVAGTPALRPEFTHKMFVRHDANDQSNLGFSINADASQITGVRYNMKFAPGETRDLDLTWKCNTYEGLMGPDTTKLTPE